MKIIKYILVIPTFLAILFFMVFFINIFIENILGETLFNIGESILNYLNKSEIIFSLKWGIATYFSTLATTLILNKNTNKKIIFYLIGILIFIVLATNFIYLFYNHKILNSHTNTLTKLAVLSLSHIIGYILAIKKINNAI